MNTDINKIVKKLYQVEKPIILTNPKNDFGDYSTTIALELAKELHLSPRDIAQAISDELQKNSHYYDVSVAGPGFINFRVYAHVLADELARQWNENNDFGSSNIGNNKTVIVEYPSNNMAKPYSIGHLRPGSQGWTIKKLHDKMGWRVITDNHLGDYGTPFGVWAVGFLKYSNDEALRNDGVYELGRVYIKTKEALKNESNSGGHELADAVQDWLLKLEQGDEEATAYNERFREISLTHIHQVMKRLKIYTDYEYGEAFFAPMGKKIVADLLDKNIAQQNEDGSIIIDITEQGIKTPVLVQKSNGAALYATNDLATIIFREKEFNPDRVVYAVGDEQSFYFKQLFAVAKKLSIETDLFHLSFGLIDQINEDGQREKMSSRKGVVLLEELLDTAENKAREIVTKRNNDGTSRINENEETVSDEDIKKIALAAIKFTDFTADRRTNILFNWDTIFSLSGFSGPSVQYAVVRINKILNSEKSALVTNSNNDGDYDYEAEKAIIIKLLQYPDILLLAYNNYEPHRIATYLYELARQMNRYYETTRIKDSADDAKVYRLQILEKVSYVMTDGLDILGIEVPERM